MFGIMNSLNVVICEDAKDAIKKGHVYADDVFTALDIEKVVVIRKGIEEGNPTVDLVLVDNGGNMYVTMLPGRLLKSIPCGE